MFRILFFGIILSSVMSEEGTLENTDVHKVSEYESSESAIDPIITGESISDEHKRLWKIQNEKFINCGLCGEKPQPFPGD